MEEKVVAVKELYARLDQHITEFQQWSGLGCKWGCGKCCFKDDIEATVLEFLPLAHRLHKEGVAEEWLQKLQNAGSICSILDPNSTAIGLCTQYADRGLICRLFGYSARTNKYSTRELVTCQIIKTEQSGNYEAAASAVKDGRTVPVMSEYYMQLHAIDFNMAREFFPINTAIRHALEAILHYYAYRS